MDYRVIYQLQDGRKYAADLLAASDAQAIAAALAAMPPGAALVDVDLPEAA